MSEDDITRVAREAFRHIDDGHLGGQQLVAFLEGGMDPAAHQAASGHLDSCASCRKELEEYRLFLAAPEPDVPKPDWQDLQRRIFPHEIQSHKIQKIPPRTNWWRIAASVVLAAGAGSSGWIWFQNQPERLLAKAYEQQRPFEYRIGGGKPVPIHGVERGSSSRGSLPAPLLRLEADLTDRLKSNPSDTKLLRLEGEAELLAGEASAAVATLTRANEIAPGQAAILASLGAAYALRGDQEQQDGDYHAAQEYLLQSIKIQPSPEALFNSALLSEKLMHYDRAADQWTQYLKLYPDGDWAGPAKEHLKNVEARLKAHKAALDSIETDPARFAALPKFDYLEQYLNGAGLSEWLPQAVRGRPDALNAVRLLAQAMKVRHGDDWLGDLMKESWPKDSVETVSRAHALNVALKPEKAYPLLEAATKGFSLGAAAQLWTRYEEVLSLNNQRRPGECIAAADRLLRLAEGRPYPWVTARTAIWRASCAEQVGRSDEAAPYLKRAMRIANASGLDDTELRANQRFLDYLDDQGLRPEIYAQAHRVVEMFWNGAHKPALYQQVCDYLRTVAESDGYRHEALYLARAAVWGAHAAGDPVIEGPAHIRLGAAAQQVGEWDEARREIAWKIAPNEKLLPAYRIENQIVLARLENAQGHASGALELLKPLLLEKIDSAWAQRNLFAALGDSEHSLRMPAKAIEHYQTSLNQYRRDAEFLKEERERSGLINEALGTARGLVEEVLAQSGAAAAAKTWMAFRRLDAVAGAGIGPDPDVLSCVQLPDGYACLVIGPGRPVAAHRIAAKKGEVESAVRRFRALCADPESNRQQLEAEGHRFYGWLIEPFAPELQRSSRLIVELDGGLGGLPLTALLDPEGRYLGERYALAVWSGFGGKAVTINPGVLLVSNPAVKGFNASRFQSLRESVPQEAAAVRNAFPKVETLSGAGATLEALEHALVRAGLVHFAGHGYTGLNDGALLLAPAPDSGEDYAVLRPTRLRGQDWSACRLVVLSACATAGDSGGANRPDNLVRALQRAGVPLVAASSWSVDSAATAEFMTGFYEALAAKMTPEDALRDARRRVRGRPEWRHPYYWAAFQLYRVSETGETNG